MDSVMELFDTAKLTDEIADMSNMTIFIPTEKALEELPPAFLEELNADHQKLKEFLLYHVATPRKCKCDLENNMVLPTQMPGSEIRVNTYGGNPLFGSRFRVATAQCARIVSLDDEVCGGMIHTVDKVLIPPAGDIIKVITNGAKYSRFLELLEFSELKDELETEVGKTLLVPTNEAFDKIDKDTANRLKEE